MRLTLIWALLVASTAYAATDVGIFDDTRLLGTGYNVETGGLMSTVKAIWDARGAVWHQTPVLTPAFLSGVSVFYTSKLNSTLLTTAEKDALLNWVLAGGTIISTGECGG
jgi:hypothetical protein